MMSSWTRKTIWKQRPECSQLLISEEEVKETGGKPHAGTPGREENNCEPKCKHGSSLQERR